MAYRVYLQKHRSATFVDTGVIEVNEDQRDNWRDICARYGFYSFRFIPIACNYHLHVAKRSFRNRCKKGPESKCSSTAIS
jgi:hypothetical protein